MAARMPPTETDVISSESAPGHSSSFVDWNLTLKAVTRWHPSPPAAHSRAAGTVVCRALSVCAHYCLDGLLFCLCLMVMVVAEYITLDKLTLGLRHVVGKTAETAQAMPGWKGTSIRLLSINSHWQEQRGKSWELLPEIPLPKWLLSEPYIKSFFALCSIICRGVIPVVWGATCMTQLYAVCGVT